MAPIYLTGDISEEKAKALRELGVPLEEYKIHSVNIIPSKASKKYLEVPSIGLVVPKERTLFNYSFKEMQDELHSNNKKELTTYEFLEFLKVAKKEDPEFYSKLIKSDKWQGDWLGNSFEKEGKNMFTKFYVFDDKGNIVERRELLDEKTLMRDKTPGINLDSLLNDSTKQGLPKKSTLSGDLHYWFPRSGTVAGFFVDSFRAGLGAVRVPLYRDSDLGVLAAEQFK